MIKRVNLFMIIWILIFLTKGSSETISLRYEIYCDSSCKDELWIKDEALRVYQEIVQGLDKDKRAVLVMKNLEQFEINEDWKVDYNNDTVFITIGNGNGTILTGDFEWVLCSNQVKPKSWIKEILGF